MRGAQNAVPLPAGTLSKKDCSFFLFLVYHTKINQHTEKLATGMIDARIPGPTVVRV